MKLGIRDISSRDLDVLEFFGQEFRVVMTLEAAKFLFPGRDTLKLDEKAQGQSGSSLRGHATTVLHDIYRRARKLGAQNHPLLIPIGYDVKYSKWCITTTGQRVLREFGLSDPTGARDADTEYMEHMLVWLDDLAEGNNIAEYLSFCARWGQMARTGAYIIGRRTPIIIEIFINPSHRVMEYAINILAVCLMPHILISANNHPRADASSAARYCSEAIRDRGSVEQKGRALDIIGRTVEAIAPRESFEVYFLFRDLNHILRCSPIDTNTHPTVIP